MSGWFTSFFNCRQCRDGELVEDQLVVSDDTGRILERTGYIGGDAVDLEGMIVAPGFIDLHTNGMRGFHFTHFDNGQAYAQKIDDVARYLPSQGVTGFYATIPTVASDEFRKILPSLKPREIPDSASLLGAHAEGPYLHPDKRGAHNASLFTAPSTPPVEVYGATATSSQTLKLVTLAPELPAADLLIQDLAKRGIRVSLGHSTATYTQGLSALSSGATCLTHVLNAMSPLHHRDPGLAGLVTASDSDLPSSSAVRRGGGEEGGGRERKRGRGREAPYFTLIADGHHLHPSVATMLFRADPGRCILVSDSVELAGCADGTYPGHAQIPFRQTKRGARVVVEGTDTLIGGCATVAECVRNLVAWSGCGVAEAVRCVTENVAGLMGDGERGRLEAGRRADLVVLDDEANVLETWVAGKKVWEKEGWR